MTAALLALCAAALWGTGDFLGGLDDEAHLGAHGAALVAARRARGARRLGRRLRRARPGHALAYAAAGGIAGVVGLGCLYRGLAVGAMGIVAPISATSPIVPLGVDLARGESPEPLQWLGIALRARRDRPRVPRAAARSSARRPVAAGVGLALVAALGFGLFVVGLGEAAQESASWATATARLTRGHRVAARPSLGPHRPPRPAPPPAAHCRGRRLRRGRERPHRGRGDTRRDRDRGRPQLALSDRDDPARARDPARAARNARTIGGLIALGGAALIAAG